jgi:hypothetical protein
MQWNFCGARAVQSLCGSKFELKFGWDYPYCTYFEELIDWGRRLVDSWATELERWAMFEGKNVLALGLLVAVLSTGRLHSTRRTSLVSVPCRIQDTARAAAYSVELRINSSSQVEELQRATFYTLHIVRIDVVRRG